MDGTGGEGREGREEKVEEGREGEGKEGSQSHPPLKNPRSATAIFICEHLYSPNKARK